MSPKHVGRQEYLFSPHIELWSNDTPYLSDVRLTSIGSRSFVIVEVPRWQKSGVDARRRPKLL